MRSGPLTPDCPFPTTGLSASLDTEETPVEAVDRYDASLPLPFDVESNFRHSGSQPLRRRVYNALRDLCFDANGHNRGLASELDRKGRPLVWAVDERGIEDAPFTPRRFAAYGACGANAWVLQSLTDPERLKVACDRCHDRFCPACAREAATVARGKLLEKIKRGVHRFVTFTLRAEQESLRDSLQRLYTSFRRLRQRVFWKRRVEGGIAFVEIKWNQSAKRWHPHLHVLTHGAYIPQKDLGKEWYAVTGDSWIVDVRLVKDARSGADYVAKYATKGYDVSVTNDVDRLKEAMLAMHGKRLVIAFGDWKGFSLRDAPDMEGWKIIARLENLMDRERRGEADARDLMNRIRRVIEDDRILRRPPERPPDEQPPAHTPPTYCPPRPQETLFPMLRLTKFGRDAF